MNHLNYYVIAPSKAIDCSLWMERTRNEKFVAFAGTKKEVVASLAEKHLNKPSENTPPASNDISNASLMKFYFSRVDIKNIESFFLKPSDEDSYHFHNFTDKKLKPLDEGAVDQLIQDWFDIQRESIQKIGLSSILVPIELEMKYVKKIGRSLILVPTKKIDPSIIKKIGLRSTLVPLKIDPPDSKIQDLKKRYRIS